MLNVLIFPIISSWVWGGGWLSKIGYKDFGGSGFHIVGGTCGLVGAYMLGPRLGLYNSSLPTAENKIREKIYKREHFCQNLRREQITKIAQQRDQVIKYLQHLEKSKDKKAKVNTHPISREVVDKTV